MTAAHRLHDLHFRDLIEHHSGDLLISARITYRLFRLINESPQDSDRTRWDALYPYRLLRDNSSSVDTSGYLP